MQQQNKMKINFLKARRLYFLLALLTLTGHSMAQNNPPTQGNESLAINEDAQPVTITNLLNNNSDLDGDPLTVTTINSNVPGSFVYNNGNGTMLYYPAPDYCGIDTIVYGVSDGFVVVTDTLFLTLNCVNDAPYGGNETMVVNEDAPATATPDLLANNGDVENDPISLGVILSGPNNGSFMNNGDGTFNYTPNPNFCGTDTVYYEVTDGSLTTIDMLVITVICINDAPTNGNEFITMDEDNAGSTATNLLANNSDIEGDFLTVGNFFYNGTNTYVYNSNGTVTYTPAPNWCGLDTIIYEVSDGTDITLDTIFITVNCINDIPTSGDEIVYTDINVTLNNIDILANNTDIETVNLIVSSPLFPYTTSQGGTVVINADQTINYTPPVDFEGLDSMYYDVCDDNIPVPACVTDLIVFVVSPDTDEDGVVNYFDLDDDNDGIPDVVEELTALNGGDTDLDGIPDILDLDSDNDGLWDVWEAGGGWYDPDNNGTYVNWYDANNNGLDDYIELNPLPLTNTDGDAQPDFQDIDDDDDSILTIDEYDNNGDGYPDDCNNNHIPNYLDPESCVVKVPEVFTPNYDGVNDVLVIKGIFDYPESDLRIFNRWGTIVYKTLNYQNNWDGTSTEGVILDDMELPVGTYYYILDLKDGTDALKGYIYLTR